MTALEKMRDAFESCTVMAGVEPDFECIYITKAAANMLFDEAEAENAKLRELVKECHELLQDLLAGWALQPLTVKVMEQLMCELGIEVDA